MASISECRDNINAYNNMSDDIKSIITYLNKCNDVNSTLLSKIDSNYEVDNKYPSIYDRIKDLDDDIKKTITFLNNSIIPEVVDSIKSEKATIAEIERKIREEEEKRKAEEEERRRREESSSSE